MHTGILLSNNNCPPDGFCTTNTPNAEYTTQGNAIHYYIKFQHIYQFKQADIPTKHARNRYEPTTPAMNIPYSIVVLLHYSPLIGYWFGIERLIIPIRYIFIVSLRMYDMEWREYSKRYDVSIVYMVHGSQRILGT